MIIIGGSASKKQCVCGKGIIGRDPESFVNKKGDSRIVKGYEPSHRAWMTFIQIKKGRSKFKCGGSIINNYWILSAGHCFCEQLKCKPVKPSPGHKGGNLKIDYKPEDHIRIITGLKDISHAGSKKPHKISKPDRIRIHPL